MGEKGESTMSDQTPGKPPIFSVGSKHVAGCGARPHIDGDVKGHYYGSFEDSYGEQAVFVHDDKTQTGAPWMGDAGWEGSFPVVDGTAPDLNLDDAEALCLRACWLATRGRVAVEA
jgi:hypothetical protein